jgi:hypothetical protein
MILVRHKRTDLCKHNFVEVDLMRLPQMRVLANTGNEPVGIYSYVNHFSSCGDQLPRMPGGEMACVHYPMHKSHEPE